MFMQFFYSGNIKQLQFIPLHLLQALVALKKGAQLPKYGLKGKAEFCPFRLRNVS